MIWWLLACFACLALGTAFGFLLCGAFTSGKMEDARAPTLIGHRPGVKTERIANVMVWTPYCLCGWSGEPAALEEIARLDAEDHAKGLL